MALILTFLGKAGTARTTLAIAAAKRFAAQGKRVLLASQNPAPALEVILGMRPTCDPQPLSDQIQVVHFEATTLLERSWEEIKRQEAQYLKTPFFKAVYGQELGVLPGMDAALALNELREYDASGKYDVIIYDGSDDLTTLRMLGMPEILSWYIRRFRTVFLESDLGKTLSPFAQPIASAVLNVDWSGDFFAKPTNQANNILDQGKAAVADPNRVAAYLVTTDGEVEIATARYLWGSAQQVGLTVGGAIALDQAGPSDAMKTAFAPLPMFTVPDRHGDDWQPMVDALPDFTQAAQAPRPITVNVGDRTVRLFLPSFNKQQVKLTQYGPEVTIEAGDQRRNILLPPTLQGKPVAGAKFQDGYLTITFGA
ncbi:MAG: ArsA family ATPase [Elainellaceae cyanobacterium]